MECLHKNIHTEKIQGCFPIVCGSIYGEKYNTYEIPGRNSFIESWCADCGKFLKVVELNDYIKK